MGQTSTKKVRFLMRHAPPQNTTNVMLVMDVVAALIQQGWSVELYAARPQDYAKSAEQKFRPAELKIHRHRTLHLNDERVLGRLLNILLVDIQIFAKLLFSRRLGVLVPDSTSILGGFIAWVLSKVRRAPYLYLVTELYPDTPVKMGLISDRGILARIWRFVSRRALGGAARIICISEPERQMVNRYLPAAEADKVACIPSWSTLSEVSRVQREKNFYLQQAEFQADLVVVYSGRIGRSHDIDTLLDTAAVLLARGANIKFVIISSGGRAAEVQTTLSERDLTNVAFLPRQPRERLTDLLTAGDLYAVTLIQAMVNIPSRVYSALAVGQPILAVGAPESALRQTVEQYALGIAVDNGASEQLADRLLSLAKDKTELARYRQNAEAASSTHFARAQSVSRYIDLLSSLTD